LQSPMARKVASFPSGKEVKGFPPPPSYSSLFETSSLGAGSNSHSNSHSPSPSHSDSDFLKDKELEELRIKLHEVESLIHSLRDQIAKKDIILEHEKKQREESDAKFYQEQQARNWQITQTEELKASKIQLEQKVSEGDMNLDAMKKELQESKTQYDSLYYYWNQQRNKISEQEAEIQTVKSHSLYWKSKVDTISNVINPLVVN
jgi:chromosome segregation ATPase